MSDVMDATMRDGMQRAIEAVIAERLRQEAKWGPQDHPMVGLAARRGFVSPRVACVLLGILGADEARERCDRAHRNNEGTYTHILVEEAAEFVEACVIHGETSDEARAEMVQVAAVALAMIECIDRKRAKASGVAK